MHILKSIRISSWDIKILWFSVFVRMVGYGLSNQVLTLYLKALQITESRIGFFMTATLVGDIILSYFLTWFADVIGRKRVMLVGSALMFVSGLVFSHYSQYHVLLAAAVLGVISPSGDETGPFKSVEEACIAHLSPFEHQHEVYALHGLSSTAGAALGSLLGGLIVQFLKTSYNWGYERCYRAIFVAYAIIGVLKFCLMLLLSNECEVKAGVKETGSETERTGLLNEEAPPQANESTIQSKGFLGLSQRTIYYLSRLLVVFMLDSLGYGFMPSAWVVYYFKNTFNVSPGGLGALFFLTNAVNSLSSIPSAFLSKKVGPVRAMLSTQIPSAIFFMAIAISPSFLIASFNLTFYSFTSAMDVVSRQVLLSVLMPSNELTKVMGITNIAKTLARCIGPLFSGHLAEHNLLNLGYVVTGICTLLADAVLAINFLHLDHGILTSLRTG